MGGAIIAAVFCPIEMFASSPAFLLTINCWLVAADVRPDVITPERLQGLGVARVDESMRRGTAISYVALTTAAAIRPQSALGFALRLAAYGVSARALVCYAGDRATDIVASETRSHTRRRRSKINKRQDR